MKTTLLLSKFILICFINIIFTSLAISQVEDYASIRNSGNYFWGSGLGKNYQEARRNALAMLSESIQVEIKSNFETIVTEENGNLEEYVKT